MRVRHIHASSGEYIAVHRNHGSSGHSSAGGGDNGMGCLVLLVLWGVWCWWQEILMIALILGVVTAVCWLGWTFRDEIADAAVAIGEGLAWVCVWLGRGIWWLLKPGWSLLQSGWQACRTGRQASLPAAPAAPARPGNYGKIIQKH
jgi:hypothetical protein